MNVLMFRWFLKTSAALLIALWMAGPASAQFTSAKRRPDPGPMPKNVHGIVQDSQGKPLAGARIFIRNVKTNVIRTLTTDENGAYQQFALPPSVDYEVYAEFRGKTSDKRLISGFLNRQDNVLNFQLDVTATDAGGPGDPSGGPEFNSFDLVRLHASLDLPTGVPAPIPSVLLLHGYGEDRFVWNEFKKQLLSRGWAVMSLDLRGHGESKTKNGIAINASTDWRTSAHEFPQDIDPALDFLKSQPRIDNRKIVVIGYDIGADLALIASGRFTEVRTVVALNPRFSESLAMAGSAQDFMPRSALILTTDEAEGNRIRAAAKDPARVQAVKVTGGTTAWIADKAVTDAIFTWLQQTF